MGAHNSKVNNDGFSTDNYQPEYSADAEIVVISMSSPTTDIYCIPITEKVEINGVENFASCLKLGDVVKFTTRYNNKIIKLTVNYIGFKKNEHFGAVSGKSTVSKLLPNGDIVETNVNCLHIGDCVKTSTGFANIICILETQIDTHIRAFTHPNGLIISTYHFVFEQGKWDYVINSSSFTSKSFFADSMYSIGLEGSSDLLVNGIQVIGLGYTNTEDKIQHPFWGTSKSIDAIMEMGDNGYYLISPEQLIRDPKTHLVCGFAPQKNCDSSITPKKFLFNNLFK